MPHDVIMPALGMAQETGIIVAWLKAPGEAVKAGDALMEVETDKATMEVEASHDGFLSDVRAGEGESVPVGQTVAVIAETMDAAASAPKPDGKADGKATAEPTGEAKPEAGAEALPEGHNVIMPALGMAQDSGVVVAWLKEAGEAVSEGDPLLEVETDKATMEVEADRAGYLGAILAEAGDDVPVGEVIAVITAEAPAEPIRRAMAAAPAPASLAKTDATPEPEEKAPTAQTPTPKTGTPASTPRRALGGARPEGRVLASPKARRLAAEQGLDLADLVSAGYEPPFHVADLDTLRDLPKAAPATAAAATPGGGEVGVISAQVDAAAFDAFHAWLSQEGSTPSPHRVFAAFAAGALRTAVGTEGPLSVAAGALGAAACLDDPDHAPLSADLAESEAAPALILRDLTRTALTGIKPASAPVPVVTITRRGDTLALHLAHDAALPEEAALALLAGLADRLQEPLRHLL